MEHRKDLEIELYMLEDNLKATMQLQDYLYLQDLKERKLYLDTDVTETSVSELIYQIMKFNANDKDIAINERQPILLYLNTNGGSVSAGLSLISAIQTSKTPIIAINLGNCLSMGAIIFTACKKRYAMPYSTIMYHSGSTGLFNTTDKVKDTLEYQNRIDDIIRDLVIKNSKIDLELWQKNERKEWYLLDIDAKELGIVDEIIGVDCTINEVI